MNFSVHRRYHNERKPFICQVCGQAFTSSVDLTSHGKIHEGVKMFICNVCYNVFANDASLERHMKRHSTDKPFGMIFIQKTKMNRFYLPNVLNPQVVLFAKKHLVEKNTWIIISVHIAERHHFGKFFFAIE